MGYNYVNILNTVFLLKVGEYCHECLIRHRTGCVSATLTHLPSTAVYFNFTSISICKKSKFQGQIFKYSLEKAL